MKLLIIVIAMGAILGAVADNPSAEITNGLIRAKLYLPDAQNGFYRGTRFDWSGVVYSLQANGHNYYGPWFNKTDPSVHDFVYRGADIVAGPCSAATGPADEFGAVGYDEAKPGGTFIKIGVGALKRSSEDPYDNYHLYEIADAGKWIVTKHSDSVEFIQELNDSGSGYSYRYQKNVRLAAGKAEMVLEHRLTNFGKRAIRTSVYNHNFLVLDQRAPGPGLVITVPFTIRTSRPPQNDLAEVSGQEIVYRKALENKDVFALSLEGYGTSADDHMIRIENKSLGAGMTLRSDRPLLRESLWSIRTVVAMEPFIAIAVEPGDEFTWTTVYDYYTLKQ